MICVFTLFHDITHIVIKIYIDLVYTFTMMMMNWWSSSTEINMMIVSQPSFITQQKNQMVSFTVYVAPAPSCNSCVSGIEKCIFECQYENHITKHKSIAMTSSQTPTHFTLPPFWKRKWHITWSRHDLIYFLICFLMTSSSLF